MNKSLVSPKASASLPSKEQQTEIEILKEQQAEIDELKEMVNQLTADK